MVGDAGERAGDDAVADDAAFVTDHEVRVGDARDLDLPADSVELVVTSPPYPMVEMWDDAFSAMDPVIEDALAAGDGDRAYEAMHAALREAWAEVARVLVPGGTACVVVGDATRTLERFRRYPNHARVLADCRAVGLDPLPGVVWHKPANSAAKFMGSGTLPPNAYVTNEHEYVLVFRNGERRQPDSRARRASAYFYEERNRWFSDVWEVRGERQALDGPARERTAAFPFEVPYRLVHMYSVRGETVLDPFWGTGTTTLAAMAGGRDSVGVEVEAALLEDFAERVAGVAALANDRARERLVVHRRFVAQRRAAGEGFEHESAVYDFPVVTGQETELRVPSVEVVHEVPAGDEVARYRVEHGTLWPREDGGECQGGGGADGQVGGADADGRGGGAGDDGPLGDGGGDSEGDGDGDTPGHSR